MYPNNRSELFIHFRSLIANTLCRVLHFCWYKDLVSLEFFIDILPTALWPWGGLNLWQKWVPGMFPGGKGGRCVWLTTLPPSCTDCLEIWEPQPPGTLRACPGLSWDCFTFTFTWKGEWDQQSAWHYISATLHVQQWYSSIRYQRH